MDQSDIGPTGVSITQAAGDSTVPDHSVSRAISGEDPLPVAAAHTGLPIDRSEPVNTEHVDDSILQFSGAGHWFLEGWIGDQSVEFLVDSGSSVTAKSDSLYQTLVRAGASVGALRSTSRTLRGANGAPIGISGCSHCVVSFMGLQTEFPILICDLSTDAIIGTDTLVLPHTLDIKNGLLFTDGGVSLQLHRIDTALSGRVFTVGHCSIPPYSEAVLHCTMRRIQALWWAELLWILLNGMFRFWCPTSGDCYGRIVLRDCMVAHISAIQSITEPQCRASCSDDSLPTHLQDLLDRMSRALDGTQQRQLASMLLQYSDLFPVPGSTLTGHTDAVEHEIDTGHSTPICCAPRRMPPQKIKGRGMCRRHAGRWTN